MRNNGAEREAIRLHVRFSRPNESHEHPFYASTLRPADLHAAPEMGREHLSARPVGGAASRTDRVRRSAIADNRGREDQLIRSQHHSALQCSERQAQAVQNPWARLAIDVVGILDWSLHE
jgi:hypothetical protein